MKKSICGILCLVPIFFACKSVPADLSAYTPIAIMTVYGNPSVPWYNESTNTETVDDGILSGAVNRMINKKNPENTTAQERIDEASALLSERMRDFGLEVIDPTVLKDCPIYKDTGKNFLDYLGNTVPAKGYDAITSSNGKLNRSMCKQSGAASVLYVNFRFQKVIVKDGVRNKGVTARLVMSVFGTDASGKRLVNREYKAVSSDYTELIKSSDWDKDKIMTFYHALENRVITEFLSEFVGANNDSKPADYKPTAITLKPKQTEPTLADAQTEDAVLAEKQATAKKLLDRGMSTQEAAEITGLPVEDVEALQN